jgi:hypothetical protein
MKKTLLLFLISWLGWQVLLTAQITDRGNFLVGGSFGLSSAESTIIRDDGAGNVTEDGPSSLQYSIAPSVGYFVLDNFAVGFGMDYTVSRIEEPSLDRIFDSDLLFGPYARYYLPLSYDKAFFLQADFGFGNTTDQIQIGGDLENISTNIFAFGIGPGFTVISEDAIGLEAIFKYNYAQGENEITLNNVRTKTSTRTNQFDFSIGVQFYFTRIASARRGN